MFALPIPVLLILTIIASCTKAVLGGYFSKKVSDSNYYTWFFGLLQSLFCGIAIVIIFLVSGGLGKISLYTLFLGVLMGTSNILALVTNMKAFAIGPFSYTTVIISLSAVIPALSGLFFGETVTAVQYVGVALMAVCLFLSPEKEAEEQRKKVGIKWLLWCLAAAIFSGTLGVLQKIHQNSAHRSEMAGLLIGCFIVSTLLSAVMFLAEKAKGNIDEAPKNRRTLLLVPVISGLVFAFPHTINLFLAGVMDAVIMFPLINLSPMILSMICGFILFREKLSARRWAGIVIGIFSTILVSGWSL